MRDDGVLGVTRHTSRTAARRWSVRDQLVAFTLLALIAVVPLVMVEIPPLVDYPNHLTRMWLLFVAPPDASVYHYYRPDWQLLPNLAMEGVMPLLLMFLPLEVAGRVFVGLTLLLMASGVAALHYALFRRISPWPLLAFLLLYNRILLWGFLNYLFGVGLVLWAFAAWVAWRKRGELFRAIVFVPLALLLFMAHLYAFGIAGLCVVAYELGRIERVPRRNEWGCYLLEASPVLVSFGIPLLLFLAFSPTTEEMGTMQYGQLIRRLVGMVALFRDYDPMLDSLTILLVSAIGIVAIVKRHLRVARGMVWPLAAMALVYLVMPATLFGSHGSDVRFAVALGLVFVAATEVAGTALHWWCLVGALLVALFLVRMEVITGYWLAADRDYRAVLAALDRMPAGSRLFTADGQGAEWQPFPTPTAHLPCLAVVRRGTFVPSLFTYPTQQPLRLAPGYARLARLTPGAVFKHGDSIPWRYVTAHYTHVLVVEAKGHVPLPYHRLRLIAQGHNFRLFEVEQKELM